MLSPFIVIGAIFVIVLLLLAASGALLISAYRDAHPSIEAQRKMLDRAVMADRITSNEYANKKIALDEEEEFQRLTRRIG